MTITCMPFCSANWKAFSLCGGAAPAPKLRAAATKAEIVRVLKNAIASAAAGPLGRGRLWLRLLRLLRGCGSRRLGLRSIQACLFRIGIERGVTAVGGAPEEELIGEVLVGALLIAVVGGDLLADGIARRCSARLRQEQLLPFAVTAPDGAGYGFRVSAIERGL